MIIEVVLERGDADRATGRAVYAAVAACLAQHGETPAATAFPIVLQGDGHSRSILGITTAPRSGPTLIVRDPADGPGVVRCLAVEQLDGQAYQLVIVRSARKLSKAHAKMRFVPSAAACWRRGLLLMASHTQSKRAYRSGRGRETHASWKLAWGKRRASNGQATGKQALLGATIGNLSFRGTDVERYGII